MLNVSVIGIDSIQQASKMALKGKFSDSAKYLLGTKKYLERTSISPLQMEEFSVWKNDFFNVRILFVSVC